MIIVGNKVYRQCQKCGKLVKVGGFFNGLHLCVYPEKIVILPPTKEDLCSTALVPLRYKVIEE